MMWRTSGKWTPVDSKSVDMMILIREFWNSDRIFWWSSSYTSEWKVSTIRNSRSPKACLLYALSQSSSCPGCKFNWKFSVHSSWGWRFHCQNCYTIWNLLSNMSKMWSIFAPWFSWICTNLGSSIQIPMKISPESISLLYTWNTVDT